MNPTLADELSTALREATDPVVVRPGLDIRVRAAVAGRRHRRNRTAVMLAPVAVVAVLAAAVAVAPAQRRDAVPLPPANQELLTRPTAGNLATDPAALARLVDVYVRGVRPPSDQSPAVPTVPPGVGPVGDPHVVWAATTAAGPAAVVVQKERGAAGPVVAIGFVGPGDSGRTQLLGVGRPAGSYSEVAGAFLGPDRREVLVLAQGGPLTWSYQHTYRPTGGLVLRDRPVTFTDGVALLQVPAGVDPAEVAVTRPGGPDADRVLLLANEPDTTEGRPLPWLGGKTEGPAIWPVGTGSAWPSPTPGRFGDDLAAQLKRTVWPALEGLPSDRWLLGSFADDAWYAYGGTPDGRRLVGTDKAVEGEVGRAYVVLVGPGDRTVVVDGGPVDLTGPVGFRADLPDGQGRLLAAKGKTFTWAEPAGTRSAENAALVPAGATDVRVDGVPVG